MTNANVMELNQKNAMALWKKQFGSEVKAKDFAGREMAKAAYGDVNSKYGWNLDHILPQSQGGKNAEHNLICCNILTNSEKADTFPCFKANSKNFKIIKVQNHYEIKEVRSTFENKKKNNDENIDFFDIAQGVSFFSHRQKQKKFNGMIHIYLSEVTNYGVLDFIKAFFWDYDMVVSMDSECCDEDSDNYFLSIMIHNLPAKDDTQELLDKCFLLNTWLYFYMLPKEFIQNYNISFCMFNKEYEDSYFFDTHEEFFTSEMNSLMINDLVKNNADLDEDDLAEYPFDTDDSEWDTYYIVDLIKTELEEELEKYISKH